MAIPLCVIHTQGSPGMQGLDTKGSIYNAHTSPGMASFISKLYICKTPHLSICYQQTLQRFPWIHSILCLLLVTNSWCFTCPLLKNNKAKWNSDSWITHKQVPAAEVGLCLVEFEALVGIQLPTELLSACCHRVWSSRITESPSFSFLQSHLRAGIGEWKPGLSSAE